MTMNDSDSNLEISGWENHLSASATEPIFSRPLSVRLFHCGTIISDKWCYLACLWANKSRAYLACRWGTAAWWAPRRSCSRRWRTGWQSTRSCAPSGRWSTQNIISDKYIRHCIRWILPLPCPVQHPGSLLPRGVQEDDPSWKLYPFHFTKCHYFGWFKMWNILPRFWLD